MNMDSIMVERMKKKGAMKGKKGKKGYENSSVDRGIDRQLKKVGVKEGSKTDERIDKLVQARMKKRGM